MTRTHRLINMLHLSSFLIGLGASSILYMIPLLLQELGASYGEIGLIGGLRSAPYAFLPLVAGYLADRLNKVMLYFLAAPLTLAGSLMLFTSSNLMQAALANLIFGTHMVFYWPIAQAIIADSLPEEERWRAYTMYSVAWSLSYVVGPLIGGWIGEVMGIRASFMAGALLAAASIPLIISMRGLGSAGGDEGERVHLTLRSLTRVSNIYSSAFIFTIGMSAVFSLAPSYLSELGWSASSIGLFFTLYGASRTASYYFMNRVGRKPHLTLIAAAVILQSISLGLLYSGDPALLSLSFILGGATTGAYFTASFDLISKNIPPGYKGVAFGLFETIVGLGFITGPAASGPFMDIIGASTTFLWLSLVALLSLALFVALGRRG